MQFSRAIVRTPGKDFTAGLTTSSLGAPDYDTLLRQHAAYVDALQALGLEVTVLDPLPGLPDAYFVEDTAVVTKDIAVITYPGAPERRGEIDSIQAVLSQYRPTARIEPPGTLDGGDVLQVGETLYVGISARTNRHGARQLADLLSPFEYCVEPVPVGDSLHLKTGVNAIDSNTLVMIDDFVKQKAFERYRRIVLDPEEAYAANTLPLNGGLLLAAGFPKTLLGLQKLGYDPVTLEMSEARKMDGGLTCMSLRF